MRMLRKIACLPIHAYRLVLSPFLGKQCRYMPTCSEYAIEAIHKYGAFKGSWMAIKRVGRCNPLAKGGIDEP